jgi:hypothetical protein
VEGKSPQIGQMLRGYLVAGPDGILREPNAREVTVIAIDAVADMAVKRRIPDHNDHRRAQRDRFLHLYAAAQRGNILEDSLDLATRRVNADQLRAQTAAFKPSFPAVYLVSHAHLSAGMDAEFSVSGCRGLIRTFHVAGMIADGTRNKAVRLLRSHSSPARRVAARSIARCNPRTSSAPSGQNR